MWQVLGAEPLMQHPSIIHGKPYLPYQVKLRYLIVQAGGCPYEDFRVRVWAHDIEVAKANLQRMLDAGEFQRKLEGARLD